MRKSGASRESVNLLPKAWTTNSARSSELTRDDDNDDDEDDYDEDDDEDDDERTTMDRTIIKLQPLDPGQPAANADNKTTTT